MKNIILLGLFFFVKVSYSQECISFKRGVFENDSEYGKIVIERKNNFQLERALKFGTIYLQKIETINDCEYIIKRYKVIKQGKLPVPNMDEQVKVKVTELNNNLFSLHSTLIGTQFVIENEYSKLSDDISEEFKKILLDETLEN